MKNFIDKTLVTFSNSEDAKEEKSSKQINSDNIYYNNCYEYQL